MDSASSESNTASNRANAMVSVTDCQLLVNKVVNKGRAETCVHLCLFCEDNQIETVWQFGVTFDKKR